MGILTLSQLPLKARSLVLVLFVSLFASNILYSQVETELSKAPEFNSQNSYPMDFLLNGNQDRSRNEYRALIDSVKDHTLRDNVLTNTATRIYQFNEDARISTLETHFFNANTQQIVPRLRNIYLYDSAGNRTVDTTYQYNLQNWGWELYSVTDSEYDIDNNFLQSVTQNWNADMQVWEPSERTVVEYFEELVTSSTLYSWSTGIGDYFARNRIVYHYTEDGLLEESLTYNLNFSTGELRLSDRTYREYNEDRLLALSESYRLDFASGEVRIRSRFLYFYEGENFTYSIGYRQPIFQGDTISWAIIEKNEFYFTESGKEDYLLIYAWDESDQEWILINRRVNIYDPYDQLVDRHFQSVDSLGSGEWIPVTYENWVRNYNFEGGTYLGVNVDLSEHMITRRTVLRFQPTQQLTNMNEYIYREVTVNTEDRALPKSVLSVFPNPSADIVQIKNESWTGIPQVLSVFDLSGRLMHQLSFTGTGDIDISQWAPGMYLVILRGTNGERIGSSQFLKP